MFENSGCGGYTQPNETPKRFHQVGGLPVVRVEAGVRQGVRDKARVRVLERLEAYGWALGERYRIEQVFGSVKGVYGSCVGCSC